MYDHLKMKHLKRNEKKLHELPQPHKPAVVYTLTTQNVTAILAVTIPLLVVIAVLVIVFSSNVLGNIPPVPDIPTITPSEPPITEPRDYTNPFTGRDPTRQPTDRPITRPYSRDHTRVATANCSPTCQHGYCRDNNTCNCDGTGYAGPQCQYVVGTQLGVFVYPAAVLDDLVNIQGDFGPLGPASIDVSVCRKGTVFDFDEPYIGTNGNGWTWVGSAAPNTRNLTELFGSSGAMAPYLSLPMKYSNVTEAGQANPGPWNSINVLSATVSGYFAMGTPVFPDSIHNLWSNSVQDNMLVWTGATAANNLATGDDCSQWSSPGGLDCGGYVNTNAGTMFTALSCGGCHPSGTFSRQYVLCVQGVRVVANRS